MTDSENKDEMRRIEHQNIIRQRLDRASSAILVGLMARHRRRDPIDLMPTAVELAKKLLIHVDGTVEMNL